MMDNNCVFCKIINNEIPSNVVYEDEDFKVILDNAPATRGHAILLPKKHFSNIYEMDSDTAAKVFTVARKVAKAMKEVLKCSGLNLLQNNGEVAGQTVFHFHLHFIPRYEDDGVVFRWNPSKYQEGEASDIAKEIGDSMINKFLN
ncbi:MAG TPA: HIT family protein [Clostridiales bacterium]|nr:HIT family protein [Clostridiales bacterium]